MRNAFGGRFSFLAAALIAGSFRASSLQLQSSPRPSPGTVRRSPAASTRAEFLAGTAGAFLLSTAPASAVDVGDNGQVTAYRLPSGLQYIELEEGTGPSPAYGQLVSIGYTSYIQLPNQKRQQFDAQPAFLFKHGSGRCIAGLDEGIHTMKLGGRRRLLIPPKLGFVDSGLGPIPVGPWNRYRLNQMLDDMVRLRAGTLIMDVELRVVLYDEADLGYYTDSSLSPEDFETLKNNLQSQAAAANAERRRLEQEAGE